MVEKIRKWCLGLGMFFMVVGLYITVNPTPQKPEPAVTEEECQRLQAADKSQLSAEDAQKAEACKKNNFP